MTRSNARLVATPPWAACAVAAALVVGCGSAPAPDDSDFEAKYGDAFSFCDMQAGDFPSSTSHRPGFPPLKRASGGEPEARVALLQRKSDPSRYRVVVYTATYDIDSVVLSSDRLKINSTATHSIPPMIIPSTVASGDDTYTRRLEVPARKLRSPATLDVRVAVWTPVQKGEASYKPRSSSFRAKLTVRRSCPPAH
jgi:hypothetical protein